VNPGILTSGYAPPPMPYGLLGSPGAVPTIDPYGYDADAARYIEAVERADGQRLELAVRLAINAFVVGCKADGIWSAIKASCILVGARTLSGALTPLVGTAPTNNGPFVSGDYNRKTGLVGDGTSKYLDSGRLLSSDPLNSQHLCVFTTTAATSSSVQFPVYIGGLAGNPSASHFGRLNNNGTLFFRSRNSAAISAGAGSGSATGLIGISRGSASQFTSRLSGSGSPNSQSSESLSTRPIFVFASSDQLSGVAAATYANARLAFYSIGESLALATLDSRVTALYNAIGAAIP
jgi:hypothetical protein